MSIERLDKGPRMSQAVIHGDTVYLAGQVAEGPDVVSQTKAILESVDSLLARAGTDKSRLLSATIWLANMGDFAAMNTVWDSWVDQNNAPARACGECRLAAPKYLVEIILVAARG